MEDVSVKNGNSAGETCGKGSAVIAGDGDDDDGRMVASLWGRLSKR